MEKKYTLLKVLSIIMIVGAVISWLGSLFALFTFAAFLGGIGEIQLLLFMIVAAAIAVIGGGINLSAGILGLRYIKDPKNGGMLITLGSLSLAISVVSFAFNFFTDEEFSILTGLSGLILPVLFLREVSRIRRESEVQ